MSSPAAVAVSSPIAPVAEGGTPRWLISTLLLVAGSATLATSFDAIPVPALVALVAGWSAAVVFFGSPSRGPVGLTLLSVCVKLATLLVIGLLIVAPNGPVGATSPLCWIPLGLANLGSGLWFLRLIRKQA